MKARNNRLVVLGTAGALSAAMLGGPLLGKAEASRKGRRNTALGLGAVTAYGVLKGNKKVAIAGGLGTAYAYSRYKKGKNDDRRQTVSQRFGNRAVYDSNGKRYSNNTRFDRGRTYYNANGRALS